MVMKRMKLSGSLIQLLLILTQGVCIVHMGTVQQIYIKDNKVPVKGGNIQVICEVLQFANNDIVRVFQLNSTTPEDISSSISIAQCTPSQCLGTVPRYTFSPSSSGITITVTNLNRSADQNYWTFVLNTQRKYLQIIVYTITPSVQYDNPPNQDQDLVQNAVTLKCSTRCAYPSPNFTWYFTKTSGSRQTWSTTSPVTDRTDGCTDSEKIYTSTLTLQRNTQLTDNTDTTVKFQCGAVSETGNQSYTQTSVDVRFAVRVTTVTLKDGSSIPSNSLEVNSEESHTLTCTSSVSRPTATIIWYFRGQEQKRENTTISSFTFTPEYSDNQKQVYCKAFNIQTESQAVSSKYVSLYVKVKVANVTVKDSNTILSESLEVTNGVSKTLTCTASESRPTATIIWYIGENDEKKREIVTVSTLTFTPDISDHNKQVYCKASQSGNPDVFSNRITLYVKVLATTPTITNLTAEKLEGDQIRYQCTSSQTRPVAIVTWKLGTQILNDVQNEINSHENELKSVTSIVTFTANRRNNNKIVYCETAIPGQSVVKVQEKMTVYWPPSQPQIRNVSFPFLEGQTGKSIYCSSSDYGNPTASATWTKQYGSPDSADTRKLTLPILTYQVDRSPVKCQLKNLFTERKGHQIQSNQVQLQVEYSPRIQILVDSKQVNTATKDEGQTLSATCNATGNPDPVVHWAVEQQSRGPTLSFDDIDRTDHGKYTCRATATSTHYPSHDFEKEEKLNVIVNYAPDVTVNVSSPNATENNTLIVKCEPKGRPADYHISSMVHKWGDVVITKILNSTDGVIEVQSAKLQDSGTYICVANNGIQDRNQKLDQRGNNTVRVKVSPKLLLKVGDRIFAGAPESTVNITAPFYSDPPPQSVQFKFKNGTEITNSSKHTVSFFKGNVKDTFYGKEVELDGYFAQLQIKNEEESDFVNYTLVINNGIGAYKSWILEHVSQSKPSIPKYFNFTGFKDGIPTFLLVGGFNGGLLQTFVIETTEVGKDNWVERLKFNETDTAFLQAEKLTFTFNISGLQPNIYDARVRTGNDKGWINKAEAPTVQFTITEEKKDEPNPPGTVAAIAGGVAAAGSVIILAIVLVFVWKKRSKSKDDRSDVLNKRHRADSDSSEENVMTENLAYVSADEVGRDRHMGATPENLYAQPQKKSKSATGTGDIYSSVQKGKKEDSSNIYALPNKKDKKNQKKDVKKDKNDKGGKKGKDKKQDRKDDVYENASELAPIKTKTYAGEENVYENPEQSKSTPKVNRNKDGLIYADLAFNDQPKGQKKLVIHGLDDMTEYVQVDFTKKADPLPDSDEEESAPKK